MILFQSACWKTIPKSECHLAPRDGWRQTATGGGLAEMAASAQVDVQLRTPLECASRETLFKNKHTHTHILSMFSQCLYCNISTLIMKMHWGFSSSLKRRIWRQSWRADKHQGYLQNKFWHICLDLQMSGREVPFPWVKYLQSAELFHPQLYIQDSPWTLTWGGQEMLKFLSSFGRREGHLFIKGANPCQVKEKGILAMQ